MSEFRLDGKTALRRLTDIRDLGLLAVLASQASASMTGQNIALDGGETNFGH